MYRHSFRPALIVLILVLTTLFPFATVAAQATESRDGWESAPVSDELIVWVQDGAGIGAEDFATAYSTELTTALEELLLFLNVTEAEQPIQIEVFSDVGAYQTAVEAVSRVDLEGQIAIADPPNAKILLPIDSFRSLTSLEAENQLRHALSHVVAGWASGFNIPRGFDEGLAQYVEKTNLPVQARLAALVQAASQNGKLTSWKS
jgi:hypothetical protein